jgi:uncharacterized protein YraI
MTTSRTPFSGNKSAEGYAGIGKTQSGRKSLFGWIQQLITQFLRSIPYSVKVFLRKNMGSMTFSWSMIFFAALWIRFILDGTYQLDQLAPPETFVYDWFNKGKGMQYYLGVAFWGIGIFFEQFGKIITNFFPKEFYDFSFSGTDLMAVLPFLISSGVLVLGAIRKWNIIKLHYRKKIFDPMSSGESLFFENLLDRINPKDRDRTMAWLEIGTLFLAAFGTYLLSWINPEWLDYTGLLAAGAVGIGIEMWRDEQQKARDIEIRLANEFRALNLQETYKQYKNEDVITPATVSFVASPLQSVSTSNKASFTKAHQTFGFSLDVPSKWPRQSLKYMLIGVLVIAMVLSALSLTRNDEIQEVGFVEAENLTFRKRPRLGAKPIGTIKQGTVLKLIDCGIFDAADRQWCKISYEGKKGYAVTQGARGTEYLFTLPLFFYSMAFDEVPFEDVVQTESGDNINLRALPSLNSSVITKIPNGASLTVLEAVEEPEFIDLYGKLIFGSWCLVQFEGQEGYCFSWYFESCRFPEVPRIFD